MDSFCRNAYALALIGSAAAVLVGCDGGTDNNPPANQAPVISSVTHHCADPIAAGCSTYFEINAADADGDTLTYSFSANEGSVGADTSDEHPSWCYYVAPEVTADTTVTLTFEVSDSRGGTDTWEEDLDVAAPQAGNSAPVVNSLTITPNPVDLGTTATVVTDATDADGDTLTYNYVWSQFPGNIAENSPGNATYTAPATAQTGDYVFFVFVDDGHGNYASTSVNLTLQ